MVNSQNYSTSQFSILKIFPIISGLFFFFVSSSFAQLNYERPINPEDVTIVRDGWGVPHIYGKTDADAAYGLAWAHAEDDFENIQKTILAINGRLSEIDGVGGAILDVGSYIMNAKMVVEERYDTSFSAEFKKILTANVQGINDYARSNPEEIFIKEVFPVSEKDIVAGYVLAQGLISNALWDIARVFSNKILEPKKAENLGTGSNAFALNKNATTDGQTYLVSNAHQPLEGPVAWYEAHVNSEEGWNMLGGTFSTGVSIFVGVNEHLGWTHTTNYPDFCDVYKLEMHPKDKNKYLFDGEWLELKERKIKLKVKFGFLKIPVTKKFYESKYGTTVKNKSGYYSFRFPSVLNIGAAEQWFKMNKAKNNKEFKEILDTQDLASQNIIYGDKDGNIAFIANGLYPVRNPNHNWKGILDGTTSDNLWPEKYHTMDEIPQIVNPACGYVYNCNNTPFSATCPEEDLSIEDYNKTMGFSTEETNRSLRFQEFMKNENKISYDRLKEIKYDRQYQSKTLYTKGLQGLDRLYDLDPMKYPKIADVLAIARKWDRKSNPENTSATVVAVAVAQLIDFLVNEVRMDVANYVSEEQLVDALTYARKFLMKNYGKLEVPLGTVQRHIHGEHSLPIGGMPEQLAPTYIEKYDKKTFKNVMGESYILLARFDDNGLNFVETVHPYGASNHQDSPHYADQMPLFTGQKLKRMTLDKDEIFRTAEKVYSPEPKID